MVPAYGRLLAIGSEGEAIQPHLPAGCTLRTVADIPERTDADLILMLAANATASQAADAARLGRPLVCAWPIADAATLRETMRHAGFRLQCEERAASALGLFKWIPDVGIAATPETAKRVLVLSYSHIPNFGDRLGYHVLNSLLPADVEVVYAPFAPFAVPQGDYDLLIVGIGNSLLPRDACDPEFLGWLARIPRAIGIFGTQYRDQYRHPEAAAALDAILDKVSTWWARYEEDALAFGRGRGNVRHLGDWLIAASPMSAPRIDKTLIVPPDIVASEVPLDRMIQQLQACRRIDSARLHPLLCALTSAEQAAFREQRSGTSNAIPDAEVDPQAVSGKFRSLLYDIFGRTFDEGAPFAVDRAAVAAYRRKVLANMEALRAELFMLLDRAPPQP